MSEPRVLCVVGARPNLMKMAPIIPALRAAGLDAPLLHTGQHYDADMDGQFFAALGLPMPAVNLNVGGASHAVQTAEIMRRFEPELEATDPAAVLVVGDVNSTLACALVAAKRGVPVVHVEAGLRSYDRAMPEEINRVLTDQLADRLYTTEREAADNLAREGVAPERVRFVGNVMIDTLHAQRARALAPAEVLGAARAAQLEAAGGYALLTLHRPSNVDEPATLARLVRCVRSLSERLPVVFALHPRTRQALTRSGLLEALGGRVHCLPPLGYHAMLGMMDRARVVLTDSGGLQEETTALGVPCLTLRDNTERPITITQGTNTLVGTDPARIAAAFEEVLASGGKAGRAPELWDGRAAERLAADLAVWLGVPRREAAHA